MTNEENVNNINNTNEDDLDFEENDSNTWTASGPMANLPTEIYCGNSLEPAVKKKIFQAEPRNKDISFTPLKMEQRMLSVMSRFDKETDKNYSRLLYKTSSVLRPIDNTLRMVYASKPTEDTGDSYESWLQLEQTVLNSRALLLDALSYGNDLRRELALKNLSSNYRKPTGQRGVFGEKLPELVQQENELNKLFNEAAFQKKRAQQNSKQKQYSPIAGRISHFKDHWIASFGKNWVTDIVQYGYRPEWLTVPPLDVHPISPNRQYKKDLKIFYDEIQALLRIGAIRELDIDTPFRGVHQDSSSSNKISSESRHQIDDISRRHTHNGKDERRSVTTVKGNHGYLKKNGIYNQQRKVNARTFSIDRVSRLQDQHKDDDLCTSADKSKGPSERMQKGSAPTQNTGPEAGVSNRKDIGNNVSGLSSSSLLQSSAPRQKLWSETARVERYSTTLRRKQVAARVVDKKSPFLEWKKFNPGRTKYYNSHRCVKYRLGCVPGQLDHPRKLDSVRVNSSHQYSGTKGDSVLHSRVQGASESNDIDSNRQHDVCSLYQPSGRDDISGSLKDRRESVDIMSETQSKIDSGTHSGHKECGSGSGIKDID
ncbi:hypothetical protein GLOIN_2v1840614 [Rhizophagus irregularis DAOM 181602=DAOM 197198]|uniref:Uncharacterized protein n=1 Tax=Rhizophagus irregularis (strain DAOM 181602 / DAOM 197198 / MUCL 43194) TaxID=747089 RepID=A0A2P4Q3V9_RHIID|nr:hypothetical protein GLOIN_2v1840614 [Rhizophagus irregularis DAOM 181602=DAOM 197198]POG72320.1 hypothetical protein GLOIN_2v1840614 [Rhizophagus irregularis DAOM 181602=DAOM 197198]|eukprot:XP_025179186.1 hypothetical protein GLOIN_2v1840614 [Rhizophagus irregularis DAOM 181602=DAOM 197198]